MLELISNHILSWLIFLPMIGALLLMFFRRPEDEEDEHGHGHEHDDHAEHAPAKSNAAANLIRYFTLAVSAVTFGLSILLFTKFEAGKPGYQFLDEATWIESFSVFYRVGVDGISVLMLLLTTFISLLSVYFSFNVKKRVKEYMIFLLILETAMMGVFCALDLVLFYVFWEAVLIPMYFLIGIWGHENRVYAAVKFFLYTFFGSVLMLVGILWIYGTAHSFNIIELANPTTVQALSLANSGGQAMMWVYAALALAFMIKVPMFPFHTWLPDAHVEAPTAGSVILAGVMLKLGTYGFLRICLPIFPDQAQASAPLFITLAVIGIVYGAIVATMQPDMKKLVAYSSVSHLGFVMLGIFSFTSLGITGAVLQSINHGVSTPMLFFLVGMLYDRRHTREIAAFGGLKRALPVLSTFFLIALFSSIALPLTNGFVGEFTILQGSYMSATAGHVWTAIAASGMVLSAVYMLWMFQRVFTGPLDKEVNKHLPDLNMREKLVLAPLVVLVFWFGCYVSYWTKYLTHPVEVVRASVAGPADESEMIKGQGVALRDR